MPKFKLSAEDKAKMLMELKSLEAAVKARRPRRWLMSVLAAGSAVVAAGSLFFALEMKGTPGKNQPATTTSITAQPKHLEAATSRLQKVTDRFGPKAEQLHELLTHTVGVLDAWAYGSSERMGEGDYSFLPPYSEPPKTQSTLPMYLQTDYAKFKQLFGPELAEIPAKPMPGYYDRFFYIDPKTHVAESRDDWAILDSINQAYQQAINYYAKQEGDQERAPGNNTAAAQAANTLREWNDLLFGGRIELSDVPKVTH
ncbi:hypothetical protein SAMN05421543_101496 [Alicyclobacillus macrosporangiidus]|uniref:Uncharacterized protein n=2 Tax=Alicyclobacillus macrosporangiidus TaxID=392015 RepID=A0A1I7FX81_9BACL|nr:hypothetical protein SAMN05421543_101496 [Alicyclobacillus macrosporangiidus]